MKYSAHSKKWINCSKCELCQKRKKVVIARGICPCDILFIGEAPGVSEDVLGMPFIGPAGHLLDMMIQESGLDKYKLAFTNLVACIPLGPDGSKTKEPSKESVESCRERLEETVFQVFKPKKIVAVGLLSEKYITSYRWMVPMISIVHPAAILRMKDVSKPLIYKRVVVQLKHLTKELELL